MGSLIGLPGLFELSDPGFLYRCKICHLHFRHPFFTPLDLAESSSHIPATYWKYQTQRQDYRLAYEAVMKMKQSGSILDVGCYRGDFLKSFPDQFIKYGIEPSETAANIAERSGIQVFTGTLEAFNMKGHSFDVITLIDVLEHLPRPFLALSKLVALMKPEGVLLVTTGNTNALPWRLMRLDYWYYSPEHVSFFNPQWFRWAAQKLGLDFIAMKKFSHQESSTFDRWRQFAQCLTFVAMKKFAVFPVLRRMIILIYPFNKAIHWTTPPQTRLWKDHMFVTLQSTMIGNRVRK